MPGMRPPSPPSAVLPQSPTSPASSDEVAISFEDDEISLPSPISSSLDSYGSSSSDESDGGEATRPRGPPIQRAWPSADEVALLEAIVAHKEQHGRLPAPADLLGALPGRLEVDAQQVATRMETLRIRFIRTTRQLSRGVVPESDDDLKILRLSRRIWKTGKRKSRASTSEHHERREFAELAMLYPCLAAEVEAIDARQTTTGPLKMAFGLIGDEEAAELEAKVKKQRIREIKLKLKQFEVQREVTMALLELVD